MRIFKRILSAAVRHGLHLGTPVFSVFCDRILPINGITTEVISRGAIRFKFSKTILDSQAFVALCRLLLQ